MCGGSCSDTEECRYDKENCEYKCCVKWAVVWGVVGALLGLLALALLALLIWCCCCRKKKKVAPPPPVVKELSKKRLRIHWLFRFREKLSNNYGILKWINSFCQT